MNKKPSSKRSHSAKGRVGVFWWHNCQVLAVRAEVRKEACDVDYRFYHETVWPVVQHQHPELESVSSGELPQGRVYYLANERRFWVRMDRQLFEPQIQAAILKAFGLPKRATGFGVHARKGIHDRY